MRRNSKKPHHNKVPSEESQKLTKDLFAPHIDSFNFFLNDGIKLLVKDLTPEEVETSDTRFTFKVTDIKIGKPTSGANTSEKLYPLECRINRTTYSAPFYLELSYAINEDTPKKLTRQVGSVPIMLRSDKCWLAKLSPPEMIKQGEEAMEQGGYFVCNGQNKLVRLLIVQKNNIVLGLERNSFLKRGAGFSPIATTIRCVRPDMTTQTLSLHYLTDGTSSVRLYIRKAEFFVNSVVLLKALVEATDREIYEKILQKDSENQFLVDRVEIMLRDAKKFALKTREAHLAFLGHHFRFSKGFSVPSRVSDVEAGEQFIKRFVFVHLNTPQEKFDLLIFMIQKLYAIVNGEASTDNMDSPQHQDILLPGHLFSMVFKEKIQEWLSSFRTQINFLVRAGNNPLDVQFFDKLFKRVLAKQVTTKLEYMLATGNIPSDSGLDLLHERGVSIIAERLNYFRYLSHFRSVHRGSFFTEMRTTSVRKLLPESWGFLCPVHTPDGGPCGLLNHLAAYCKIITEPIDNRSLPVLLASLGMLPNASSVIYHKHHYLPVLLDGRIIGHLPKHMAKSFVQRLRYLKTKDSEDIPKYLEVGLVENLPKGQYPGLYLFTGTSRMMRPVINLATSETEYIGIFEQVYLNIACMEDDMTQENMTHREIKPTHMLSVVASLTPFSDFNQSPRNMYQCQMGKQTMGTAVFGYTHRVDNKIWRILTPQSPITRTENYELFHMDEHPMGTNAVVAVISYTGYDMEDAMIINKSSYERGFAQGLVYKNEVINLTDKVFGIDARFCNQDEVTSEKFFPTLDWDGLPIPGTQIQFGDVLYSYTDAIGQKRSGKYKSKEDAVIEHVHLSGDAKGRPVKAIIKLRYQRNPVVGDKFSSRHGQKGVMSILWPERDMPFSESGMTPDVIINPHAFPSRMTIGMLMESMAAKAGAIHGIFQNATPFSFDEKKSAVDHYGEQLLKAGYNYYGNEPMYSGITGQEFFADIYFGVVYYQRLRHMVGDKYQVRATGPINAITKQPVKGRKKGGGVRLGEMERDSLIAHGSSFMLQDRLFYSSDADPTYVCIQCGSILSPLVGSVGLQYNPKKVKLCRECATGAHLRNVCIPFVFRYLLVELAAMNIRVKLHVKMDL